jgi:hypothetical protein
MTDPLLQQALDALETPDQGLTGAVLRNTAIAALRERIAQPFDGEWPNCKACGGNMWNCAACHPSVRLAQPEQEPEVWKQRYDTLCSQAPPAQPKGKFAIGDSVHKISGSQWTGRVVGTYSTELTPEGYCVESIAHPGSVQIYPAAALEPAPAQPADHVLVPLIATDEIEQAAADYLGIFVKAGELWDAMLAARPGAKA